MAWRTLLKIQVRQALFDIPTDEDSLIRHYHLSPADRLEIEVRRREHNRLGFAIQLCLMRHPGRALIVERINQTSHLTLHGLKDELAARGVKVSHDTVWTFLRREGLRFKKNAVRP